MGPERIEKQTSAGIFVVWLSRWGEGTKSSLILSSFRPGEGRGEERRGGMQVTDQVQLQEREMVLTHTLRDMGVRMSQGGNGVASPALFPMPKD